MKCKSCDAEIVFLETKNGKHMPVDFYSLNHTDQRNVKENVRVIFNRERGHVSHFATCPDADKHRRK